MLTTLVPVLVGVVSFTSAVDAQAASRRPVRLGTGVTRLGDCTHRAPNGSGIPAVMVPTPVGARPPHGPRDPSTDPAVSGAGDAEDMGFTRRASATNGARCTQMWITASPSVVQVGLKKNRCLSTLCVGGAVPGSTKVRIHVDTSGVPAKGIPIRLTVKAATNLTGLGGGHNHLETSTAATGWVDKPDDVTDATGNFDVTFTAGMRGGVEVITAKATVPDIGVMQAGASVLIGLPQTPLIEFFNKTNAAGVGGMFRNAVPTGGNTSGKHWNNHWVQAGIYNYMHEFFSTLAMHTRQLAPDSVYGNKEVFIPVNDISLPQGGRFEVVDQVGGQSCSRPLPALTALGVTPGPDASTVASAVSHQAHDRGIDFDVGFCAMPQGGTYINGATCVPCAAGTSGARCQLDWSKASSRAIKPAMVAQSVLDLNKRYAGNVRLTFITEGNHYHVRAIPQGPTVPGYLKP